MSAVVTTGRLTSTRHPPRKRRTQYAAASRFYHRLPGVLGRPVKSRAMTAQPIDSHWVCYPGHTESVAHLLPKKSSYGRKQGNGGTRAQLFSSYDFEPSGGNGRLFFFAE